MTDLQGLLRIAGAALDQASTLVTDMAVGSVTAKGDRDMVSELDYAVEEQVRSFLLKETPEIGFLGEESGGSGIGGNLTWALDPVDGTANIVNGLPLCAVSLGLVENDRSVLGVIDLPFLGQRYRAAEGHGAYCGETRIAPSRKQTLNEAIVAIGDYAVGEGAQARNRRRLALTALLAERVLRVRMLGSAAVDLVWVASGKLDASIAMSNHPWDMAGGVAIAREAGAVVMDVQGAAHDLRSAATIAVAPGLRDDVLRLLEGL
ncbi:inositol monophosphatase family protein [Streptomyces sp. NPDC020681]|uniref:inositol monophosphatase family protein n=1 Tax=Streptomyces sp. NPDC020681 TaxID=3365083 RepID=UPI003789FBA8